MLDYSYPSLKAFAFACVLAGKDASLLLATGVFIYCLDGWIVERSIALGHA